MFFDLHNPLTVIPDGQPKRPRPDIPFSVYLAAVSPAICINVARLEPGPHDIWHYMMAVNDGIAAHGLQAMAARISTETYCTECGQFRTYDNDGQIIFYARPLAE